MAKSKKEKKVRYYGVAKVKEGSKVCFISSENKNGWSLGIAFGKRNLWLRNLRFKTRAEVERAMNSGIVFIELKNKK